MCKNYVNFSTIHCKKSSIFALDKILILLNREKQILILLNREKQII